MCQYSFRRASIMLRLSLLLILLSQTTRTAYVTDHPSFADRLDKLYEKLEKLTVAPAEKNQKLVLSPEEKLYAKLDRLNSLTPDRVELNEYDEEVLSGMQQWGRPSAGLLREVVAEMQRMKIEPDEEKSEKVSDGDYGDADWNDEFQDLQDSEPEYAMDGSDDWDPVEDVDSTPKPVLGVTPSAITRQDQYRQTVVSAVDPIAATNERPRILDDSSLNIADRATLRRAVLANIGAVVRAGKCLTPQPRWLAVRQLAPAADTVYMPPCVQLHRCAPDAGCCHNEAEVCAPVEGKYVAIPFYLNKADGNFSLARMLFFNHTRCACVSRETLQSTVRTRLIESRQTHDSQEVRREESQETRRDIAIDKEGQSDWRSPTEEPELERDDEPTAPPQLRRCTCPGLFMARMSDTGVCSCVCDWPDSNRRRECLSLARGKEHFGLRDRVCVSHGDCNPPTCEHGPYERSAGRCPHRRFRRIRYHGRRYQPEKTVVV